MKTFIFIFIFAVTVQAKVTVAFIEMRNYYGQVIQLEPGGRFAHSAISYQGQWLQAHPIRGVELVPLETIRKMGQIKELIEVSNLDELDSVQVNAMLGKPFDSEYLWDDQKIYCSELVAKLIGLEPKPMYFSEAWPIEFQKYNGLPGLSPDAIYQILKTH